MVSIGRALMANARLIAMDEPTASLAQRESEALFATIAQLAKEGVAILYVTHRLVEVMSICDYVTVLRDGKVQVEFRSGSYSEGQLIAAITGEAVAAKKTGTIDRAVGEGTSRRSTHLSSATSSRRVVLFAPRGGVGPSRSGRFRPN